MTVFGKVITWFGQRCTIVCDCECEHAWGINCRPKKMLSDDPDDYVYYSDEELEEQELVAPADPGTYEGGHGKPQAPEERFNKWCARQCERCTILDGAPPNMAKPEPNIPQSS